MKAMRDTTPTKGTRSKTNDFDVDPTSAAECWPVRKFV
jgi:hypothetical protein